MTDPDHIERLLLKHEKEKHILLTALEAAFAQIERLQAEVKRLEHDIFRHAQEQASVTETRRCEICGADMIKL